MYNTKINVGRMKASCFCSRKMEERFHRKGTINGANKIDPNISLCAGLRLKETVTDSGTIH